MINKINLLKAIDALLDENEQYDKKLLRGFEPMWEAYHNGYKNGLEQIKHWVDKEAE